MLRNRLTKKPIKIGDAVITFRGEEAVLTDVSESENRVYLKIGEANEMGYYPEVIKAEFSPQD